MTKTVPGSVAVLVTLVGVTWRRLLRGRALWVLVLIGLAPSMFAAALQGKHGIIDLVAGVELIIMALVPSVFVASSIGEEIEDRTTTYLWSRPLPRWTVIVGKLLALAPIAAALVAGSWLVATRFAASPVDLTRTTIAFATGAVAVSAVAAGIALLVPKNGMALSIIYLAIIDLIIGGIPASLQAISITRQVRLLAGISESPSLIEPALTLVIIAVIWLGVGLVRLRRLES